MPVFHYKAIAGDGKPIDGVMEAADTKSVIARLRSGGSLPISVEPKSENSELLPGLRPARLLAWRRDRVGAAEVTAMTRELATLLGAGMPLDESLRMIARHARERSRLKAALTNVHERVQAGVALSAALELHSDVFDPLYVKLMRAGEASGSLARVTARLAEYREQSEAFRATVISALTYPAALVCVAAMSLTILMVFVIPRFIPLFSDAGQTLPLLTEIVFGAASVFRRYWWLLLALGAAAKLAADRWLAVSDNRERLDAWLLRAPIVGEAILFTATVRFTRTLETLLRNGLPLIQALTLVRDLARNRALAKAIDSSIAVVRGGGRLAAALERARVLPDLAVEFIMVGEESGQVEDMLQKAADMFEARAQQKIKRLLTLLEPALILGLGAVIAVVIVSILLAMLGLNELVA